MAVKMMKSRKAPGINSITLEIIKSGEKAMIEMLYKMFIVMEK